MAAYSYPETPRSQFGQWLTKALPHRRIIVGSEHGARYYSFSRSAQIAALALAVTGVTAFGWMALALKSKGPDLQPLRIDLDHSAALVEHDLVVAERNRLKTANGELNEQLADVGHHIARLFEASVSLAAPKSGGAAPEITKDQIIGSSNLSLWTSKIENGLGVLEQEISSLRSSRAQILEILKGSTAQHIARLEGIVSATGLRAAPLLKAVRHLKPPRRVTFEGGEDQLRLVSAGGDPAQNASLKEIDDQLRHLDDLQYVIRHLPIVPPLEDMAVTSGFGKRRDPFTKRWKKHEGLDFRAPKGTPILAPAEGTVTFAGRFGGYGYFIEIDHGGGVRTRYGHMSKVLVKKRQQISIGDRIGTVGNSGRSTGVHLHYEVRYHGRPHDPMNFIRAGWHVFKG